MAISKKEVSTTIKPDLSEVPLDLREAALDEIGRYVVTEAALIVGDGVSPVDGYGAFKKLSEQYADEEKGGDKTPNLELNGDLMGSLDWRVEVDGVEVGFFNDQAIKAYGHHTGMKGHPWLDGKAPVRRIIPDKGENFQQDILDGIDEIIEQYKEAEVVEEDNEQEAVGERRAMSRDGVTDWLNDPFEDEDDWWL